MTCRLWIIHVLYTNITLYGDSINTFIDDSNIYDIMDQVDFPNPAKILP